jgi:hypothetical protein
MPRRLSHLHAKSRKEHRLPRLALALAAAFFAAVSSAPARAETAGKIALKPGLWEVSASSGLLALVPALPADRIEQLRALAREHGFNMPRIENGAATTRICLTPEMAGRDSLPDLYSAQSGCNSRNARRSGNRFTMDVSCNGGRFRGAGRTEAVLQSPERFSGQSSFTGSIDGQPVNERADTSGRWVDASCEELPPS